MTKVHDPDNTMELDNIFAILSEDEDGNEGLVALNGFPLVFGELETLKMIPIENLKKHTGKKIKLVAFGGKTLVRYL